LIRLRRVDPSEADELCAGLAEIHLDALNAVTLLWLTTHADTEACAFSTKAVGYTMMGTMPNYSRRPDGTIWPGAFYFKEVSA
jgi:hypothetical protein